MNSILKTDVKFLELVFMHEKSLKQDHQKNICVVHVAFVKNVLRLIGQFRMSQIETQETLRTANVF